MYATFGLDDAFLQRLDRLSLAGRRPAPARAAGHRASPRYGSSPEFADFRNYTPGDDLRRVDWNAYARLDRLFLRLYRAEEASTLTMYLDTSRSMGFADKALAASRLAATLSYIALNTHERVAVASWSEGWDGYLKPQMGMQALPRVWTFIERQMEKPAGGTNAATLQRTPARPGLALVLSDMLTDSRWEDGLLALQAAQQEVGVIQLLSPDELQPDLRGDWELRDAETDERVEVTGSTRLDKRYLAALDGHIAAIRTFCRRHGMAHIVVPSDVTADGRVLALLRGAGIIA